MAASARALLLCRFTDFELSRASSLTPRHRQPFTSFTRDLRQLIPARKRAAPATFAPLNCLIPGVDGGFREGDGGGLADDHVSIRKAAFNREFSVLANMLRQIEPLDTSLIGKSVSGSSKESMKMTISTMLGLLPSDHFDVTIRVSPQPLARLLVSSIITGYTLWNAEYRVSLTRNFNISPGSTSATVLPSLDRSGMLGNADEERRDGDERDGGGLHENFDGPDLDIPESLGDLSPAALSYIQELKSELETVEKELNAQKLENIHIKSNGENSNDLLEYLRSLESDMVTELSRPSSPEVEQVIQQLVQSILQRIFKYDSSAADFLDDSVTRNTDSCPSDGVEHPSSIGTSRDYLAKLLFWCMLLGHHMRSMEYRLQLSCVVGLL